MILNFDQWLEANQEELDIKAAETGADRELDYDSDAFYEKEYEVYLKTL